MRSAPIQYYDPATGVWLESCGEGTPCRFPGAAVAPADAQDFRGMDGLRWTGAAWIEDEGASARAFEVMYPDQALAQERAAMVADKWQIIAAMNLIDPGLWPKVLAFRASADCDPITAAAIDYATRLPRQSETIDMLAYLLDLDPTQVDDLFRLAMRQKG